MTEMTIDASPSTNTRASRLTEIARVFLKIGGMSYGWGIMGVMHSVPECPPAGGRYALELARRLIDDEVPDRVSHGQRYVAGSRSSQSYPGLSR